MADKLDYDALPVPYDALIELGLTHEQIVDALERRPLTVACQAAEHPGAWFDVALVKRKLQALAAFRHTKGRWAGVRMRLGEGLDPWQVVWVIAPIFGWVHHDVEADRVVRVIRTAWVEVPRKNGKALDVDTPILTGRGWSTMGQLEPGDQVHGANGRLTRVVATSEVFDDHPCYEVELSDGQKIVADAGHLWTVRDRYRERTVTVDTETMAGNYLIGHRSTHTERRYSMPAPAALDRPAIGLPVAPYLLGAWLGDGATATARITSIDPEVISRFAEHFPVRQLQGTSTWAVTNGLQTALQHLGVLGNKHVPEQYLLASAAQRLELLRGLMDTDGTVIRGSGTPRCEFTNTNRALADAVLFLARSLGWKATLREGRAMLRGRDCGPKYQVSWAAYSDRPPFHLARKSERLAARPVRPARSSTIQVVAVRRVPTRPTRCIEVAAADGLYLAGRGLATTHNSTLSSGISGVLLLADSEPGAEVYNAAGSTLQAGRVFEDAKRMLSTSKSARRRIEPLKDVVRVPKTGSILRVLSRVAETAHGLNVSGAIIDEVHTLRLRRALVEAIETSVGARDQPLIVYITTADEAEEGTVYDEKHQLTRNLALGILKQTSHYGVIWAAEPSDDPFSEETQRKANPGFGKSPTRKYLQDEATKAQNSPTYLATYLRLSLNLRKRSQARWLSIDKYDELRAPIDRAKLRGRRAWGGMDLSAVSDFTAWAVWVESNRPGFELDLIVRYFVPGERVEDLQRQLLVPLQEWIDDGHVIATDGDVIDYATVKAQIIGDCRHFDMQRISYDRMFAGQIVQELDEELRGVEINPVGQGFIGLSAPAKEFERLLGAGLMRLPDDPVTRWMASVVEVKRDQTDNLRPVKPNRQQSSTRIDGIQAAVTGLDGWIRTASKQRRRKVVVGSRR